MRVFELLGLGAQDSVLYARVGEAFELLGLGAQDTVQYARVGEHPAMRAFELLGLSGQESVHGARGSPQLGASARGSPPPRKQQQQRVPGVVFKTEAARAAAAALDEEMAGGGEGGGGGGSGGGGGGSGVGEKATHLSLKATCLWVLVSLALSITLTQLLMGMCGYNLRFKGAWVTLVYDPSTRAQTTESVASLEHSVYDNTGVFQVTLDTLEEETLGTLEEETLGTLEEETLGTLEEETLGTLEEETLGMFEEETLGTLEEEIHEPLSSQLQQPYPSLPSPPPPPPPHPTCRRVPGVFQVTFDTLEEICEPSNRISLHPTPPHPTPRTGVFQVTFDTLEEEIREIRDQLNGNQKTGAKPAAPVPPVVQLAKLRVQKTGAKPAAPVPPVVQLAKLRVQVEELSSQHALLRGKLDSLVAAAGGVSAGAEGSAAAAAAAAAAVAAAEGSAAAGVNSTGGVAVQQAVGKLLEPLKARVQRDEERLKRVQERVDVVEKELADSTEVLQQLQVEVVTGGKVAPDPATASVAAAEIPATTAALATPNVPAATVIPASDELAAVVIPEPTEPAAVVVPPPNKPAAVPASKEPTAVIIPDATEPAAVVIPEPTEPAAVVVPETTVPAAVVFPAPKEPAAGAVAVPEAGEPAAVVVPSPNEPAAVVIPEPADPAAVVVPVPSDAPGPDAPAVAGAMGGTVGGKEGEAEGEEEEGKDDADLGPPEDYPGEGDVGEEGEEGGEEEGEEEEGGEGEAGTGEQVGKKSAGTAGETEARGEEEAGEGEREVGEEGEEEGGEVGEEGEEDESRAVGGIDVAEVQQCGDETLELPPEAKAWKQRSLVQITPDLQLFSAYRYNPHTIAMVGLLSPDVPTLPLDDCLFRQLDGSQPIAGSLLRLQVESTAAVVLSSSPFLHPAPLPLTIYSLPPFLPFFPPDFFLSPQLSTPPSPLPTPLTICSLLITNGLSTPPSPLPTPLTICSLLITNGVSPPRLREWLDYHRVAAGAARFVLYRHSKSHWPTELRQAVGEYERMGMVEVTDIVGTDKEQEKKKSKSHLLHEVRQEGGEYERMGMAEVTDVVGEDKEQEKLLALQDCLYRTSLSSNWTLPLDLDEYLSASPPATLPFIHSSPFSVPPFTPPHASSSPYRTFLALQDCLYRTSLSSTWTLPLDLDEYLSASPPATLPSLLSASSPSSLAASPYLSLGAVRWSTEVCLGEADVVKVEREGIGGEGGEEDEADAAGDGGGRGNSSSTGAVFAVERAVFREPAPVCNADAAGEAAVGAAGGGGEVDAALCEGDAGTRRVIVNPRKVRMGVGCGVKEGALLGGPMRFLCPSSPSTAAHPQGRHPSQRQANTQAQVNRVSLLALHHPIPPKGGATLDARTQARVNRFLGLSSLKQAGGVALLSLHHPISSKGGATLNAHTQARVNRFLGLSSLKQAGRLCSSAVQQTGDAAAAAVDAAASGAPRGSVESLEVAEGARLARECPIEKTRECAVSLTP
ncbi:unnamed protein product [Closterium sp. NIES-64]|nr:unnamed protein product [Closterium sp. NIES-64]